MALDRNRIIQENVMLKAKLHTTNGQLNVAEMALAKALEEIMRMQEDINRLTGRIASKDEAIGTMMLQHMEMRDALAAEGLEFVFSP